ncbi:MAG: hypothetical protein ACRYFS_00045 [Janthinobacterium lividum]
MTSLNGSTNKLAAALLGLFLFGGGCASRPHTAVPVVHGYANLTVLVQHQPGLIGLSQYDAALARLDAAARNLPLIGQPDPKMAVLTALPLGAASSAATGQTDVNEIAQHLSFVQQTLIGSLNDHRKSARADQLRRQQELWRREARRLFPVPARTAEISSDLTLQLLQANVAALTQTLSNWDKSKPPAPALIRLRTKVEADKRRLETLIAGRIQTREAARAAREEAIRQMHQARMDYVQTQGAVLTAHLEADDARIVSAQKQRLSAQRLTLLGALARPELLAVMPAGNAGTLTLPNGPGAARATLSAASLRSARTKLTAQRSRWVQYLFDDTRASALDTAARHHWNITFGAPRQGDRDMTTDLERAMAKG